MHAAALCAIPKLRRKNGWRSGLGGFSPRVYPLTMMGYSKFVPSVMWTGMGESNSGQGCVQGLLEIEDKLQSLQIMLRKQLKS